MLSCQSQGKSIKIHEGSLIDLQITFFDLIPYVQGFDVPGVRLMTDEEKRIFHDFISECNQTIQDDSSLERKYSEFCDFSPFYLFNQVYYENHDARVKGNIIIERNRFIGSSPKIVFNSAENVIIKDNETSSIDSKSNYYIHNNS